MNDLLVDGREFDDLPLDRHAEALHQAMHDAGNAWATPAEFARRCRLQAAMAMSKAPEVSTSERY